MLKISYEDGSSQVIQPTSAFDGDWKNLAAAIAETRKYTYKIINL